MKLDNIERYLNNIQPPLKGYQKSSLSSMFYDAYIQGIEEGKNQVKNGIFKLIEKMLEDSK